MKCFHFFFSLSGSRARVCELQRGELYNNNPQSPWKDWFGLKNHSQNVRRRTNVVALLYIFFGSCRFCLQNLHFYEARALGCYLWGSLCEDEEQCKKISFKGKKQSCWRKSLAAQYWHHCVKMELLWTIAGWPSITWEWKLSCNKTKKKKKIPMGKNHNN